MATILMTAPNLYQNIVKKSQDRHDGQDKRDIPVRKSQELAKITIRVKFFLQKNKETI